MRPSELHINFVFEIFLYPGDWFSIKIVYGFNRRFGIKLFPVFVGIDYWRSFATLGTVVAHPQEVVDRILKNKDTMNRIVIENWQQYGREYVFFANLVDEIGEWIMLQVEGKKISAIGKKDSIKKFTALLDKHEIKYSFEL